MASSKKYPVSSNFILCEDVRKEEGNKVSLLGFFSGGDIQLVGDVLPDKTAIESVCIYAIFNGGDGSFKQRMRFVPAGAEPIDVAGEDVLMKQGTPHVVTVKFKPFPVHALGDYSLTIYFDDHEYTYSFPVKMTG